MAKKLPSKIAALKRETHRADAPNKRKENTRSKIVRFLIVCEGMTTEPNYFKSLTNDYSIVADIRGKGMSTCALVRQASLIKKEEESKTQLQFDRVWVVFDKDNFIDFNQAIRLAKNKHFGCAWSNEAFELWYFLHFQYSEAALGRRDYIRKLEAEIRKHKGFEDFEYLKNDSTIYNLLTSIGDEASAKRNAKRMRDLYEGNDYENHNPCTTVDLLVEELEHPDSILSIIDSSSKKRVK